MIKKSKLQIKVFNRVVSTFFKYFDTLSFSYKTYFLSFIIAGGMIMIILLSQISVYTLKNDFDVLFQKRTKPIIQLENIKDTYKINIYDTFYDIQHKNIQIKESKDIISLGQQLINKDWKSYQDISLSEEEERSDFSIITSKLFCIENDVNSLVLHKNIILNINTKIEELHRTINNIVKLLENRKFNEANKEIDTIYSRINSVNIYISNLINYDLNLAIIERERTQKVYKALTTVLNISIVFVFVFSIALSLMVISNFRKLHFGLEDAVNEKTKELQELNESLEKRIKTEVTNSRKKDLIMFQQSKLVSLGEMLGNIAHQWRQPLGSLMMIIQSFQTKMELGKLSYDFVEKKTQDAVLLAQNMSNTLDDFQNFFSPNKDKSFFSVKDCVQHSIELSKYMLEKESITLNLIAEKDLKIYGFYNELSHVILNMISNSKDALKNIKEKRIIKIVIKEYKNYVRINIFDNGGGIDETVLPQIFDPYYTTKYKSAGTGIGLYMSKQIIEKHMNGNIKCKNVYNKIEGNPKLEYGALFTIDIPLEKEGNDND